MTRKELERLADLLRKLYEEPGDEPRADIVAVRYRVHSKLEKVGAGEGGKDNGRAPQ